MFMLRNGAKGARFAPFVFVLALLASLSPTEIGYQDIAALLARQPGVAEHWQQFLFASSRRSLQVASFNLPRPIGTHVPETAPVRLASLESRGVDVTGSLGDNPLGQMLRPLQKSDFPKVVRSGKGDRLPIRAPQPATTDAAPAESNPDQTQDRPTDNAPVVNAKTADAHAPLDAELEAALNAPRLPQYDAAGSLRGLPKNHPLNQDASETASADPSQTPETETFSFQTSSQYFGNSAFGPSSESLERWRPGEEPTIVLQNNDPDMKLASLSLDTNDISEGESVAGKGQVTSESQRPRTPAERLGLDAASRAKSEKCLTEAIYFEARGEAVRGQMAVAQVVVNRAFSGYYPNTVCGVVYQNSNRHLACQFTFACDGIRDVVKEPDMWERAKKIAQATLDGRIWLPEVGKSTHYHAYWVRPSWVNEMKKMYKFGVHTFYRPRAWGDGADAPSWGDPAETAAISAKLAEAAKSSAEMESAKR
ncbi:MAG: cell wall hydrolase [Rhizobiales bacterium]|nr:cell wall hydrolase [Hyphomicrobiales bacterium]